MRIARGKLYGRRSEACKSIYLGELLYVLVASAIFQSSTAVRLHAYTPCTNHAPSVFTLSFLA